MFIGCVEMSKDPAQAEALFGALGVLAAGVVGLCAGWAYGRILLLGAHNKKRRNSGDQAGRRHLPLWRRWGGGKSAEQQYELVEQHDA